MSPDQFMLYATPLVLLIGQQITAIMMKRVANAQTTELKTSAATAIEGTHSKLDNLAELVNGTALKDRNAALEAQVAALEAKLAAKV